MDGKLQRVLFVNSEMSPYVDESGLATTTLSLAQRIQEQKVEIRSFMPRYGLINERKNQLHEVIRLSGMNIVIKDVDRQLIIKVASLPAARMQVYFIDNEDYFRRKAMFGDAKEPFFKDNAERAVFFARGVLETVKKLRWSPDIVHCSGWISHVLPLFLKKSYSDDPIFSSSKVVLSLYDDMPKADFDKSFASTISYHGITDKDVAVLNVPSGKNLAKMAIANSDGVIFSDKNINPELAAFVEECGIPSLKYDKKKLADGSYVNDYKSFYESLK